MDSDHIKRLLNKYWNCETSLEEEQLLREYFNGQDIHESLKESAPLFQYFELKKAESLDESFDEKFRSRFRDSERVIRLPVIKIARIAAGVLVVVAATFFIHQEVKKSTSEEMAETYSDPRQALEETKRALMMISNSFNKAQQGAEEIKLFNEAETKLRGEPKKDKQQQL